MLRTARGNRPIRLSPCILSWSCASTSNSSISLTLALTGGRNFSVSLYGLAVRERHAFEVKVLQKLFLFFRGVFILGWRAKHGARRGCGRRRGSKEESVPPGSDAYKWVVTWYVSRSLRQSSRPLSSAYRLISVPYIPGCQLRTSKRNDVQQQIESWDNDTKDQEYPHTGTEQNIQMAKAHCTPPPRAVVFPRKSI